MAKPLAQSVALLGAGALQRPFILAARTLGFKVIALDQNPHAVARNDADVFHCVQIADIDQVLKILTPVKDDLVFTCTVATDFTHIVGRVNDEFSLPGPNTAQGKVLTHKGAMRDFCSVNAIRQPTYIYSKNKEAIENWATANVCSNGFVIKPVQNMGARGVMFIQSARELCFAFEFAAVNDPNGEVILEHYIPAKEISVDALVFEGKVYLTGVADRLIEIKDKHFFIENGHSLPGNNPPATNLNILNMLQIYADNLSKITGTAYHGALKGDLRISESGEIYIGEIAGRLSGGYMSTHTFTAAHGHNLMQLFARLMSHDTSVIADLNNVQLSQGIAIERSLYAKPGLLSGLPDATTLDTIKAKYAVQGVIEIICNYHNGEIANGLQNNIGKVFHTVIHRNTLAEAEQVFAALKLELAFESNTPTYNARAMAKISREKFNNNFCWVCKVCDGGYCASGVPGMGGRGDMNTFRDNSVALAEYKIVPHYTGMSDILDPDTTLTLFGNRQLKLLAPIFSAPITGSVTNLGGSITEYDYAIETGSAMVDLGLMPTFGDGATYDKYRVGLHAITALQTGIAIFKPRADQDELLRRIGEAKDAGAIAWGIDIDGVSFKTMVAKSAQTAHKSLSQLRDLAAHSPLPFILKGVMSERDADTAIDAGAAAIVVSNHGGRVLDGMPGTARVLPRIASHVRARTQSVQVFCDGGIRSGADIFRMLALGADGVLIGRPIAIIAVGLGRVGVKSLIEDYIRELKQTMKVCAIAKLKDIHKTHISKFI